MRINYHDLYEKQFENLVAAICVHMLGPSVQKFSTGPDGGRDARFRGTAKEYPSEAQPTTGLFVIQAKHTEYEWAKVSDPQFSGERASSVVSKEIPRIRRLRDADELDHYILYTNRRAGGQATAAVERRIMEESGVKSVTLFGNETLDLQMKTYPRTIEIAELDEFVGPLRVWPDELAEIIVALGKEFDNLRKRSPSPKLDRDKFKTKNKRNQLSDDAARTIVSRYMKDFGAIRSFLASPANRTHREMYEATTEEFNAEIIERRAKGVAMDTLLNELVHRLTARDGDLRRNIRLTRTVVYYMYWICDLGVEQ